MALDLRLLGPIEATLDGRPIPLGPTKQRAVLAMLALQVNRTVSVDRLVEGLWSAEPPDSAPKMVQLYVSQLRKALAGDSAEILTRGRGYELRLAPEGVDAERFERLIDAGGAREALALWRGDALSDVVGEPFAAAEIRRLEELWLRATEQAIEDDLAGGRHAQVIGELEALVAAFPLQERLHRQRVLALYRCGRQSEALAAYRDARRTLVEEIGVEPGPELRRLHDAVLRQDPALDAPAVTVAEPSPSGRAPPRRLVVLVAALAIFAGLAAFAVSRWFGPEPLAGIDENFVGLVDSDGDGITAQYPVGRAPRAIVFGAGSAWVANAGDATVSRVEPGRPTVTIPLRGEPGGLAFGAGSLWVTLPSARAVARIDPATNRELRTDVIANAPRAVAFGHGALWVGSEVDRTVTKLDLADGASPERIDLGTSPTAIAVGAGSVWVASEEGGNVFRIEPGSGAVATTIDVGHRPVGVAVGAEAAWIANRQDATVSRIDVTTDTVTHVVPVGQDPSAIAFGDGAVWVADSGSGTVSRIDPATRRTEAIDVRSSPSALAVSGGAVWTAALASRTSHRGGRLTVETNRISYPRIEPGSYADTAALQAVSLAYDGLVAYRRSGGTAFGALVGNLAESVPDPSPDGRTYVFRLRRGIRYSDGTAVRPADFRASLEDLLRRHGRLLPSFYSHIIGAPACVPTSCDLSRGIVTDEQTRTITIHLSSPDPELLDKLASQLASVVPAAQPFGTRLPPPGTGPYRIASFARASGARLVRNPHFQVWSQDARPDGFADEIVLRTRDAIDAQVTAVERGAADVVILDNAFGQPLPAGRLPAIVARNPGRVHTNAAPELDYMFLNVRTPPFDDPRVRRAVNYAVDRRKVAELAGGPDLAQPTCQILPPGFPSYAAQCRYTITPDRGGGWIAPDLDRARRLVARSGTAGTPVTVWGYRQKRAITRYFVTLLQGLGYPSTHRLLNLDYGFYRDALTAPARPQIGIEGWSADLATPSIFAPPFLCGSIHARSGGNPNLSRFCDRSIDSEVAAASAARRPEAGARWQRAYRHIADAAPVVPLVNRRTVTLVSGRVGNYQQHPLWGPLLDQIWVR